MSIATELTRLNTNKEALTTAKTAIASAITTKGGTVASGDGFADFATDIASIPSGGGRDMTVTANQIKAYIIVSGLNKKLATRFCQTVAHGVTVDFGDGTDAVISGTTTRIDDSYIFETINHEYDEPGEYVITWTATSGVLALVQNGYAQAYLINAPELHQRQFDFHGAPYTSSVIELSIGDNIVIQNNGLSLMTGLKKVNRISENGIIPQMVRCGLPEIVIPDMMTSIPAYVFSNNRAIIYRLPSTLVKIEAFAFVDSSDTALYDFTKISLVDGSLPFTVESSSAFNGINQNCILLFKDAETAAVAKTTTNLTEQATKIHYVGE